MRCSHVTHVQVVTQQEESTCSYEVNSASHVYFVVARLNGYSRSSVLRLVPVEGDINIYTSLFISNTDSKKKRKKR